jgi:tRNA threonylcarbamoyladenosine biosynthesis protein TsaE
VNAGGASAWPLRTCTRDAEGTRALGEILGSLLEAGDIVLLVGGLGAGKTTLVQGVGRGLGVEGPITSPTFTLLRQYRCGAVARRRGLRQLLHADLYRLDTVREVVDLGLSELVEDQAAALVEWGDAAGGALGDRVLTLTLVRRLGGEDDLAEWRDVEITASDGAWDDRRAALVDSLRQGEIG